MRNGARVRGLRLPDGPGTDEQPLSQQKECCKMRVDLAEIRHIASNSRDLNNYIDTIFTRCRPDDPPYMSDLLIGYNQGGIHIMMALAERAETDSRIDRPADQRFSWKLKVLKDEWGQPVYPGDKVYHSIYTSPNHGEGKPYTASEISIEKMNGQFERNWITKVPYTVDSKGCITCGFVAASYFLQKWGIHGISGAIISHHKVETSGDPQEAPKEGLKHVHYWRFKEIEKATYDKLDDIAVRAQDDKGPKKEGRLRDR